MKGAASKDRTFLGNKYSKSSSTTENAVAHSHSSQQRLLRRASPILRLKWSTHPPAPPCRGTARKGLGGSWDSTASQQWWGRCPTTQGGLNISLVGSWDSHSDPGTRGPHHRGQWRLSWKPGLLPKTGRNEGIPIPLSHQCQRKPPKQV